MIATEIPMGGSPCVLNWITWNNLVHAGGVYPFVGSYNTGFEYLGQRPYSVTFVDLKNPGLGSMAQDFSSIGASVSMFSAPASWRCGNFN